MNDSEKIKEIKQIFKWFHGEEEYPYPGELDTIDVCMRIEAILDQ